MKGLLARLFGARDRKAALGEMHDPALLLARDWVLASGGRVVASAADWLRGQLPDGTAVGYTCVAHRARQQPDLIWLQPDSPGFDAFRQDIVDHARTPDLRIKQPWEASLSLARAAFAPPHGDCTICAAEAQVDGDSTLCAGCPLRQGRLVLVGASAVREVTVESERERTAHESVFRVRVTSSQGCRDELIRIAVDGASGAQLEPLPEAMLRTAQTALTGDTAPDLGDSQDHITRAEALARPAIQASARLARAQVLLEYQRQQHDLVATYERLLIEAPESTPEALKGRERALDRLANASAIGVDTQPVAAATIRTPDVQVRVRLRDGASLRATIDPCRGIVAPRCAACDGVWQVGVRCAEGHITCRACQRECAHCGRRRCSLCAMPAFDPCGVCGEAACAACAHATARGHHKARSSQTSWLEHAQHVTASPARTAQPGIADGAAGDREPVDDDLCMGDLDAMTPATWRAFVLWFLAEIGYGIERELGHGTDDPAFICRPLNAAPTPPVVAISHRPTRAAESSLTRAQLTQMCAIAGSPAESPPGTRRLLITTARDVSGQAARAAPEERGQPVDVFDRLYLARWLSDRPAAHRRARDDAALATEERAAAASRLRALVTDDLTRMATQLAQPDAHPVAGEARASSSRAGEFEEVSGHHTVARQALSALETLIEQWEASFAPRPTRHGTQEVAATVGEFDTLTQRAAHLLAVLQGAIDVIDAVAPVTAGKTAGSKFDEWLEAVRMELAETCQALAARCQALDPGAWRSFDAVRDPALAQASVEHLAAARRSGARARRVHDELEARGAAGQGTQAPSHAV